MPPLLSIVTPSFNQARFLPRCLASVRAQPEGLVEHIVIDGAGDPDTPGILAAAGSTLAHARSEPDRGQSHAINVGFELAAAPFGGWLNADDWYQPGVLAAVADHFAAHPETDLLICRCRFVTEDGRVVHAPVPPERIDEASLLMLRSQWFAGHSIAQPEAFFRLSLYKAVGGLDESNHHSMDHHLWLKFLEAGARVRQLDLHVANLAVHPQQKTADKLAAARSIVSHSREWLERRGAHWPLRRADVASELDALHGKLTRASRYAEIIDRALGGQRDVAAIPLPPARLPVDWAEALRETLASLERPRGSVLVVAPQRDHAALSSIVGPTAEGDEPAFITSAGAAPPVKSVALLIVHASLATSPDPAALVRSLASRLAPGAHVLISAEPERSDAHTHYLKRLRARAVNKITQPDDLILAPHADPHLRSLLETPGPTPLESHPHPLGLDLTGVVAAAGLHAEVVLTRSFGRCDFLPLAPFPTLPKLAPRGEMKPQGDSSPWGHGDSNPWGQRHGRAPAHHAWRTTLFRIASAT